jgi:hypothetical protein
MRATTTFLVLIAVISNGQEVKYPRRATIYAYDKASKGLIDPINVWEKKEQPGGRVVAKVYHDEPIIMLKREGRKVYIETNGKVKGWISYWFIKEFQSEANKDPVLN